MLRSVLSLFLLVLWGLALAPLQALALRCSPRVARRIPVLFHRHGLRLLGVRVSVSGDMAAARPLLMGANHVSWLDIPVLSSLVPLSFVSKAEVGRWPVVGTLARLQRTIFIDRARRSATHATLNDVNARLQAGDAIVIFPEGTTGDGNRVLPFRSSLLGAACDRAADARGCLALQPVSIAYTGLHGLPLARGFKPYAAWYGDMELIPHLWDIVNLGGLDVHVHFGPCVETGGTDRKALAQALETRVRSGLQRPAPSSQPALKVLQPSS